MNPLVSSLKKLFPQYLEHGMTLIDLELSHYRTNQISFTSGQSVYVVSDKLQSLNLEVLKRLLPDRL